MPLCCDAFIKSLVRPYLIRPTAKCGTFAKQGHKPLMFAICHLQFDAVSFNTTKKLTEFTKLPNLLILYYH